MGIPVGKFQISPLEVLQTFISELWYKKWAVILCCTLLMKCISIYDYHTSWVLISGTSSRLSSQCMSCWVWLFCTLHSAPVEYCTLINGPCMTSGIPEMALVVDILASDFLRDQLDVVVIFRDYPLFLIRNFNIPCLSNAIFSFWDYYWSSFCTFFSVKCLL